MKKIIMALCVIVPAMNIFAADKASDPVKLESEKDKLSYSIGHEFGTKFIKSNELDIDLDVMMNAIKRAMKDEKPLMTETEVADTLTRFQKDVNAKRQEKTRIASEKNKKDGETFLSENKKKEGVKVLENGLQYKMITEGTGKQPSANDVVTVNYKGSLINGKEFDSSYKRNEPATFRLNQVIKGWTEGLQLVKTGGKIILYIPSELAYGTQGAGQLIEPNSVLVFEVELISISDAEKEGK